MKKQHCIINKFNKFFPYILLIYSTLNFIFIEKNFTAFEQNTLTFIPGLEFLNKSDIGDFYTLSILNSPKIVIIYIINFFFNEWAFGVYFFKIFLNISVNLVIWFLYISVIEYYFQKDGLLLNKKIYFFLNIVFILFVFGIFKKFQGAGSGAGPLGWGSIQYLKDFNSMHLSFILGVFGIIFVLKRNKILNLYSVFIFSLATLIHPVVGINNILLLLILLKTNLNYSEIKNIFIFCIFAIALPIIFLKILFLPDPGLSGKEFFDIYVKFRHPHHYLISDKIFNISLNSFLMWSFFFTSILIFSYMFIKKILKFNLLVFLIFHFIPLIQFFLVEIFHIKIFIELGITRFTTLLSIIILIQLSLNFLYLINKKNIFLSKKEMFYQYKKIKYYKYFILSFFITILLAHLTYIHPMKDDRFKNYHQITNWVKENIYDEKEIIIVGQKNNLLIDFLRVFGNQKIFYDYEGFPFSAKNIIEYKKRGDYYQSLILDIKNKKYKNLRFSYQDKIGYIIFDKDVYKNRLSKFQTIYVDNFYIIKKIN